MDEQEERVFGGAKYNPLNRPRGWPRMDLQNPISRRQQDGVQVWKREHSGRAIIQLVEKRLKSHRTASSLSLCLIGDGHFVVLGWFDCLSQFRYRTVSARAICGPRILKSEFLAPVRVSKGACPAQRFCGSRESGFTAFAFQSSSVAVAKVGMHGISRSGTSTGKIRHL
jgi:hypothetical protein